MATVIQVRDVPDELHEALTDAAHESGVSLNRFVLRELHRIGRGLPQIRRWLLEHDQVDAIVALPTSTFHNTSIATYVWILDNTKPAHRVGTVQLIDGTGFYASMRKNLGSTTRELSAADRLRTLHQALLFSYGGFRKCRARHGRRGGLRGHG